MEKLELCIRQLAFAKRIFGFKSYSVPFLYQHRLKLFVTRTVIFTIFFYISSFKVSVYYPQIKFCLY